MLSPLMPDAQGWLHLLGYFLSLSLLAVGGAIATAPDMQRHLVGGQGWLTDSQFSTSIAIAQAAPGPNVLFVALIGWNIGLNAVPGGGWPTLLASAGASLACMLGILLPSSLLTWSATRWLQRHQARRAVRAFRWGMAPLVVGMMLATGWILARSSASGWPAWLLTGLCALLVWKTRIHLLWLLCLGATLGAFGLLS